MYKPQGFTETPEVAAILGPREIEVEGRFHDTFGHVPDHSSIRYFEGLTVADAIALLALLPPEQADDAQNCAPTFQEFIVLGGEWESRYGVRVYFHGYHVPSVRDDERITIEGVHVAPPHAAVKAVLRNLDPDELDKQTFRGQPCLRAWWD